MLILARIKVFFMIRYFKNLVSINGFRWKYMLTAVNRGLLVFGVFDNLNFYVIKILMLKRLFL